MDRIGPVLARRLANRTTRARSRGARGHTGGTGPTAIGPNPVAAYIASQPAPARKALERVRRAIRRALPGAEEVISYQIPAYKLRGRIVIYFAGWKNHYSLYPVTSRLAAAFPNGLARYKLGSGTLRFPRGKPVPATVIERIARLLARDAAERATAKGAPKRRGARVPSEPAARRTRPLRGRQRPSGG